MMIAVLVTNIITSAIFTICITILAISFNNIDILWWFVLLPFLGYSYKEKPSERRRRDEDFGEDVKI